MSSVSSIALSGMNAASLRLQASANNIANAGSNADIAGEAVELLMARIEFAANAEILHADSKMTQALLDITV